MNLGPTEVLISFLFFPALTLLPLYLVIRLGVRHGVTDAHRRLREEGHAGAQEPDRGRAAT